MMHLLWILLLVPVFLFGLGVLIFAMGDFDPSNAGFSFRQIMTDIFGLVCLGFWGAVLLSVVFAPPLLLFYAAHLSYDASAFVGLPVGFGLITYLLFQYFGRQRSSEKASDNPEANTKTMP